MSMKTSIIHILAQAMSTVPDKSLFPSVKITTLNPKSVTYGQLYGTFDPNSREWCEGIASNFVRVASKDTSSSLMWIAFDGSLLSHHPPLSSSSSSSSSTTTTTTTSSSPSSSSSFTSASQVPSMPYGSKA